MAELPPRRMVPTTPDSSLGQNDIGRIFVD